MRKVAKLLVVIGLLGFIILMVLFYLDRLTTLEGNVVFGTIQEWDTRILLAINPEGYVPFFNVFFLFITTYLDKAIPALILVLFVASFFVDRLKKFQFILLVVLIVYITNSYATNYLKGFFARARPQEFTSGMEYYLGDINPLELKLGHTSFPSGHTSSAFSLMVPLIVYFKQKWARVGFLSYACLQGLSRMWVGAHYPTDVLMGAYVATLLGVLLLHIMQVVVSNVNKEDLRIV